MPLRSSGKGQLLIGNQNNFGFKQAPRLGSGEILLQPRYSNSVLSIGNNNYFSNNISIVAVGSISIGCDCLIGNNALIVDSDFHGLAATQRRTKGESKPVSIGNNVWIGANVTILKGVSIGENSVIGAMSLVTGDVPPNSIFAGNPAKKIRDLPS
ncbi:MAG TPA: acyltransferase [Pirellulaceae bacterium]|nr:acyltransferase [Pirellulaceae bacterium]HMO93445.1 acyltransferase [Pirellulaceae bacterium]HMP68447.1 acyltransferase [Pirellulaceae bacterium]